VNFIFHLVGTAMEVFKILVGSWIYPEASLLRIGGVPRFTGFMYAAIGSYIARCWRLFDFRFRIHPPLPLLGLLGIGIYVNFYTHHLWGRHAPTPWVFFQSLVALAPHAAFVGLRAGCAFHLDCRDYRHLHGGVDVPPSAARLGAGALEKTRRLVSLDDHQLRLVAMLNRPQRPPSRSANAPPRGPAET